jgi:hypothetical protein
MQRNRYTMQDGLAAGRPRRAATTKLAKVSESERRGLFSLCEGNGKMIAAELAGWESDDLCARVRNTWASLPTEELVKMCLEVMRVGGITVEQLLAQFSTKTLGDYAVARLGKSGNGTAYSLAERIHRQWSKPSFQPLPMSHRPMNANPNKKQKTGVEFSTVLPDAARENGDDEVDVGPSKSTYDAVRQTTDGKEGKKNDDNFEPDDDDEFSDDDEFDRDENGRVVTEADGEWK